MYSSSHDQNNYRFIEICFQVQACQWDRAIALVQAGTQADKLTSAIDRVGNNKFYQKSRKKNFLVFSRLKRDVFFNFCVCH